jgi:hypothetical protein
VVHLGSVVGLGLLTGAARDGVAGHGFVSYPGHSVPVVTTIEDRLYFFSGSADLPPGQGVHERVADTACYDALAGVRHWRRMLSNFWPAEFTLGERTYRTVEHAFQAAKIALVDPVLAERFELESDTELAHGDGAQASQARAAGRRAAAPVG